MPYVCSFRVEFNMENIETTKIKAQGRVRLLTVIVLLLVLFGGIVEYKRLNAPDDEVMVVYKASEKVEKVKEFSNKEDVKPVVTVKKDEVEVNLSNAVDNFFGYFEKVREDLENVVEPSSALDKIIPVEVLEEENKPEVVVEEGKIEIFDSEKGTVAKEEPVVEEPKTEEKVEEPKVEEVTVEPKVEEGGVTDVNEPEKIEEVKENLEERANVEEVIEDVSNEADDEEVPLDEVNVEVNEVPFEETEALSGYNSDSVEAKVEVEEKVEEMVEQPVVETEANEEDISKARSEIENIVVDVVENSNNGDFSEEIAGGSDDAVIMKFGEAGISIEGPEGVALKIDENGLSINGLTVDMPEDESESENELDENTEAIVNKFKNINKENIQEVEDEAINLLQGINMQNN